MFQPQGKLQTLLGLQMAAVEYLDATRRLFGCISLPEADVRVISGEREDPFDIVAPHTEATLLDVSIHPGGVFSMRIKPGDTVCLLLLAGAAAVGDKPLDSRAPLWVRDQRAVSIAAAGGMAARVMAFAGVPSAAFAQRQKEGMLTGC